MKIKVIAITMLTALMITVLHVTDANIMVNATSKVKQNNPIAFKAKELNGKIISNSIFKNSKLTVINIWATFCGPCKKEMPDLGALSKELKANGVQFLGIVGDTAKSDYSEDDNNIALAKVILKESRVTYKNLIINKQLYKAFPVEAVPTTILVDRNGRVIVKNIVGSRSKAEYKDIILKALKGLK